MEIEGLKPHDGQSCGCQNNTCPITRWGLVNYPLASVYAPVQSFDNLYDVEAALDRGTMFSELDLPFLGETVTRGGGCRG